MLYVPRGFAAKETSLVVWTKLSTVQTFQEGKTKDPFPNTG